LKCKFFLSFLRQQESIARESVAPANKQIPASEGMTDYLENGIY
jgi:hypothetical protein